MKRFSIFCMAAVLVVSAQSALAQQGTDEHSAHYPEQKAKDAMPMTPDQCAKLMSQHHEGMKMDKAMMKDMKHCKMMHEKMKSDAVKSDAIKGDDMMKKSTE